MLHSVKQLVDLLERLASKIYPVPSDEKEHGYVPRPIDHVEFPTDSLQGEQKRKVSPNARDTNHEAEHTHAPGANRKVELLCRHEEQDRDPAEAVAGREDKDHGDGGVYARLVFSFPVRLGQGPDDE